MSAASRWSDVKLGVFALVALLGLVAGSLWILGSSSFAGERSSYTVLMKNSAGIQTGDRVRLAGVSIGRIQSLELLPDDPWPVRIEIRVRPEVPIREGSSATMATSGLLGASFLQLVAGPAEGALLPPGSTIKGSSSLGLEGALAQVDELAQRITSLLENTASLLEDVGGQVEPVLGGLQSLLSEENTKNVEDLVASTRAAMDEISPRVGPLLERLDRLSSIAEVSFETVPELAARMGSLLDRLDTALGPDGERLVALLDGAESSFGSASEVLDMVQSNRGELEATLHDLRDSVANLKEFSEQIRRRPSSLVRNLDEPDRRPGDGVQENGR